MPRSCCRPTSLVMQGHADVNAIAVELDHAHAVYTPDLVLRWLWSGAAPWGDERAQCRAFRRGLRYRNRVCR